MEISSRNVVVGPSRAPHRAMYKAMGLKDEDLGKPFIGISHTGNEATPCNIHLGRLAQNAKKGVSDSGGTPREFATIAVSDGIAMGHEGMKASLVSREIIADSIEVMVRAHQYDGLVGIAGSGRAVLNLLENGIRPKDILSFEAFENAITVANAIGGSTNAVLHLLALSREVGVKLSLDDFERIRKKTPHIADMRPGGFYVMLDLDKIGGIPILMKSLAKKNLLNENAITATGKTLKQNLGSIPLSSDANQKVLKPIESPIHLTGTLEILRGTLAPDAAVGGNNPLVKEGDEIVINIEKNTLDMIVSESELAQRRKEWKPRKPNYETGALAKYASLVGSASEGAITSPLGQN